jgi:hypothetical protein
MTYPTWRKSAWCGLGTAWTLLLADLNDGCL